MNKRIYNIIIFILVIIFFILFLYYIFNTKNQLIQFRVTKTPYINKTKDHLQNNKFKFNNCTDMCNKNFCDEYHSQMIKYDLCKECKKENKCYDSSKQSCVECKNNESCEYLYGCDKEPPKNPLKNYCTKCWK